MSVIRKEYQVSSIFGVSSYLYKNKREQEKKKKKDKSFDDREPLFKRLLRVRIEEYRK